MPSGRKVPDQIMQYLPKRIENGDGYTGEWLMSFNGSRVQGSFTKEQVDFIIHCCQGMGCMSWDKAIEVYKDAITPRSA